MPLCAIFDGDSLQRCYGTVHIHTMHAKLIQTFNCLADKTGNGTGIKP